MQAKQIESTEEKRKDLIAYMHPGMAEHFSDIPMDLLGKSDFDLEKMFAGPPTPVDWKLRRRLWSLFDDAKNGKIEYINPIDLYDGVCTRQNFFIVVKNPIRLAWLSINPASYETLLDRTLFVSLSKVINYVQETPVDGKNFANFIKLIEQLSNRVIGPVTQRLETKNLSVNISQTEELSNPESVNKKLDELKQKLLQSADVVDVEAE